MEVVINIPDETYKATCNGSMLPPDVKNVVEAIKNGTPLPKGHGDLIDRRELKECMEIMNTIKGESKYAVRTEDIKNTPVIIKCVTLTTDAIQQVQTL